MIVSGYMATQVDVLRSERVAMRALQSLELFDRPRRSGRDWQRADRRARRLPRLAGRCGAQRPRGQAGARLQRDQRQLHRRPTRSSRPRSPTPSSTAYIDTTLDLRVEPAKRYNAFFDERAKELRDALEKAQARLSAYQREKGILVTDERLDVENARLARAVDPARRAAGRGRASRPAASREARGNPDQMQEVLEQPAGRRADGRPVAPGEQAQRTAPAPRRPAIREVVELQASIGNLRTRDRRPKPGASPAA